MKTSAFLRLVLVLGALLLAGCGKTEDQKKMEADLNDQIMKGHDVQMAKVAQIDDLIGQLDTMIAANDSLDAAAPKQAAGRTSSAMIQARDRLQGSRSAMESWMAGHSPYNEGIKHEQAMVQLQSDLNALQQVGEQMDTAIADATQVINEQKQFRESLATKTGKRRR